MRADEFYESAVDELTRKLPSLKRTDYDAIDKLMRRISTRHDITGKKLHDLFVSKYGESPDHWIKQYKNKLTDENIENRISEGVESSDDVQKIKDFIKWTIKTLNVQKPYPKIVISKDTEVAQNGHHTGMHSSSEGEEKIWVYVGKRNLIDIFRTIFHELVHQRQHQLGMIKDGDSYPGSPIEAMADMLSLIHI